MFSRPPQVNFSRVLVSIPSQVRALEDGDEWQAVDWVRWHHGELLVHEEGFLMVFKFSDAKVKPIPMGNLIGAAAASDGNDSPNTIVARVSDSMYQHLLLSFETQKLSEEFSKLAQKAQAKHVAISELNNEASMTSDAIATSGLAAAIIEKYPGRYPLVFDGAELYGPVENACHDGNENLLGSGAIVLLDPGEGEDKVGRYSLLFFAEDGVSEPLKTFSIGPHMLKRMEDEEDGPVACFEFDSPGAAVHQLAFDALDTALAFARDYRVRAKLIDVSLKTVNRGNQVREARSKIEELQRNSLGERLKSFACTLLMLLMVAVFLRVAIMYMQQPDKAPQEYLLIVTTEAFQVFRVLRSLFCQAGSQVCELALGTIPVAQLQKCVSVGGMSQINECIAKLVSSA
jgi:hypothetical protein|mmetsp:Transcript_18248/g.28754  ORF Transcript_18248/g.28754 Transcript_18248/m.28754 type:complete len:401 (+) Transcript_18248:62-1264(+)